MTEKYIIYCDESEKDGRYFSDFYGGILVESVNIERIENDLFALRTKYSFYREFYFALQYSEYSGKGFSVAIYPDTMPESEVKILEFKKWCVEAVKNMGFNSNLELIQEKKSHEHALLQAIDVIMGAIQFVLNDKHLEIPDGKTRRGKKTLIKEKVYRHIRGEIGKLSPDNYRNFNIGKSTANYISGSVSDRYLMPYRHWQFIPTSHHFNSDLTKK